MNDRDRHLPRTIDVRFLLDEISARCWQLQKQFVFPDDIHRALRDGALDELRCIAAMIKKNMTIQVGNPINVNTLPAGNPNDPNLFITNLPQLLTNMCKLIACLERQTVFPDTMQKAFHDGRLNEARSIDALIKSQIYVD